MRIRLDALTKSGSVSLNYYYIKTTSVISSHPLSFQFALSPSDFSSSDVPEEELEEAASRGVRIMYSFPWGQEPLETLWNRGDAELLQTHRGVHSKLQVSLLLLFSVSMWTLTFWALCVVSVSAFSFFFVKLPLLNSHIERKEALQLQH